MNVFNVITVDGNDNSIDVFTCASMDVAVAVMNKVYENIKKWAESETVNPVCKIDNRVRSRCYSIVWNNLSKNENGEIVYPDDYKEYESKGYIVSGYLWTKP